MFVGTVNQGYLCIDIYLLILSAELQFKIYEDFLHYFLPEGLLDFFEPVMAEHKTHINPTTKAQVPALHKEQLLRAVLN